MQLNAIAPWAAVGAISGATWYWWFENFMLNKGQNQGLTRYVLGFALYAAVMASIVFHP